MKKINWLVITFVCLQSTLFAQSYTLGDVNHSGKIDVIDALMVAQYSVGLNPPGFDTSLGDVNKNGSIEISDALLIARLEAGLITQFPGQTCTGNGRFSYNLVKATVPSAEQNTAYGLITEAMEKAIGYYNCFTNIVLNINVYYDPGVPTAQANYGGPISFGKQTYMNYITAMHEMSHCAGVGTISRWSALISNGIFTGANATAQLRAISGNSQDVLHADTQHFWPYGLNYTSEVKSEADVINHCKMIMAIRKDLGL